MSHWFHVEGGSLHGHDGAVEADAVSVVDGALVFSNDDGRTVCIVARGHWEAVLPADDYVIALDELITVRNKRKGIAEEGGFSREAIR